MNVSSSCSQCGAIANPTDRFCNTCGSPLQRPAAPAAQAPAQPQAYGAPPPQYAPQGYQPQQPYPGQPNQAPPPYAQPPGAPQGAPQAARCQQGHDIAPGASYCPYGHPIALDAMQFASDPNAYARAGAAQGQGYGQPAPSPFDAQRPAPPPAQPGFGMGAPPQAYAPQPQQYAPPPQYAQPQPPPPPQPIFQPAAAPPPGMQPQYAPPPAPAQGPMPVDTRPEPPPGTRGLRGFVVSFQANAAGDFWPLMTGRTAVGRANAADPAEIALADATISSRHATFVIDGGTVVIEDTSSTNGTYVNEENIGQNGRRELRDGDRLRFGGFTTLVKILGRV
jgi:hypothetical protein